MNVTGVAEPAAESARENRRLGIITQVTNLGDFVSFFAILKWLSDSGVSTYVGGYAVVVKSLAVGVGAYLIPIAISKISTKRVIFLSQMLSSLCALALLILLFSGNPGTNIPILILTFSLLFFQTVLKQLFDGARETHSKLISSNQEHMPAQAQLLAGFYGAQFLGPLVSFALVRWFPLTVPLALDLLSFLCAAFLALRLEHTGLRIPEIHVLRPLRYLGKSPMLRDLFLLRSVVFWFSMGLFNYLLFAVVTERYGLSIIYSAFIYSVMGLGATLSSSALRGRRWKPRWAGLNEGVLACGAQAIFAVSILVFFHLPSLPLALVVLTFLGVSMGVNSVVTQTLRRKLTTDAQFPEVVGLELIVGRVSDVAISSVAAATMLAGSMSYEAWLWVSAAVLLASALLHLRFIQGSAKVAVCSRPL